MEGAICSRAGSIDPPFLVVNAETPRGSEPRRTGALPARKFAGVITGLAGGTGAVYVAWRFRRKNRRTPRKWRSVSGRPV